MHAHARTNAGTQGLLKDFILQFRTRTTRFYYHTDSYAVKRVVAALKANPPPPPLPICPSLFHEGCFNPP